MVENNSATIYAITVFPGRSLDTGNSKPMYCHYLFHTFCGDSPRGQPLGRAFQQVNQQ